MIEDAIRDYQEGISLLKSHLGFISDVKKLISQSKRKSARNIYNQFVAEKIFEYKTNIISLYGLYEHCIESMIQGYIITLSTIVNSFDDYPEQIKDGYIKRWKNTHKYLEDGHSKFSHLDDEKMVDNLYNTIKERKNVILSECYIPIGGNYRHKVVTNAMSAIGLGDLFSGIKNYSPMCEHLQLEGKYDFDSSMIFNTIDDLVERRNEIAHGGTVDSIVGESDFINILEFVSKYAVSIGNFLQDNLIRIEWNIYKENPSFRPDNILDKLSVVLFKIKGIIVKKGDSCIISSNNFPHFQKRTVLDLHIENADGTVEETEMVDSTLSEQIVSIKIDNPIRGEYKFFSNIN